VAESVVFGDAEAAVCDILRASARVAAFDSVTVATDLVGFAYPDRRLRVTRTGGLPTLWMRVDNATVEVEALAESKAVAYDLAAAARASVFAARGVYAGNGLALYDVLDTTGLTWSPDPLEIATARYLFTLALVTKPTAVVLPVDPGPDPSAPTTGQTGAVASGSFVFHQSSPGAVWQIGHALGYDPAGITVIDADGYIRDDYGVQYVTSGQLLRLSFDISIAGVVYLS
jgi:hypothetical protein